MFNNKKGNNSALIRLLEYIVKNYKVKFIFVSVAIFISAVAAVLGSVFIQQLIDKYIEPLLLQQVPNFSPLIRVLIIMAIIYYIGVFFNYLYSRYMVDISQGLLKDIRDDMFSHMQKLPIKYSDTHSHGEIMSRYTNDTDTLRQMISQGVPQMLSAIITIIFVFLSMVYINIYMTILVVVLMIGMVFVTNKIATKSSSYFVQLQTSLGNVNGYIEEMLEGQKVIKVFNHEEEAKKDFDVLNGELNNNSVLANRYANILMPVMANLGTLMYVLIAVVGGTLAINNIGGVTLGGIAAFLLLSGALNQPLTQIGQQLNFVAMALAGAERIFNLLDEPIEQDSGFVTLVNIEYKNNVLTESERQTGIWAWKLSNEEGKIVYTQLMGDVRFENVNFGYKKDLKVLKDITLYAKPGQKVAFVGATGAGKTTITNLINRFYDIDSGIITYDGINIKDIKKADLRRSLGIVLQDTHLFTGTIADNIRYGKLNATDEEVKEAAKLANADEFISSLPEGYNTLLSGEGAEISQGQRQLLSIARVAISNPPVLILDEATSSIDPRTEAIVQKGMDSLMEGRTVFVIAHKLSTIRNSDVIIMLDFGEIIERGSHEQLLAQKGKYYQLYTGVFELE